MPVYDCHIQVALVRRDGDEDSYAWALLEKFIKATDRAGVQLNFTTFKKDGETYPKSEQAMKVERLAEIRRQKQEIEARHYAARREMSETADMLRQLEEEETNKQK